MFIARLKSFIRIFSENANTGKICLMGAEGADFYSLSEDARGSVRLFVLDIIVWITDLLDEGRQCGDRTFDGLPRTRALLIATNLAASLHMARILRKQEFQNISGQLFKDICPSKNQLSVPALK